MRDAHSIPLIALLHPKVRASFQAFIEASEEKYNITIRIVQGLRTFAEQDAIYQQGRTTPGKIVSNAPAGSSYHNYGLAVDIVPLNGHTMDWDYDFGKWAPIAAQYKITWGGNFPGTFKDYDHFENKCGLNWRDLLKKRQAKDFIPGTEYVNI